MVVDDFFRLNPITYIPNGVEEMGISVTIPMQILTYTDKQFADWKEGRRENCPDCYCKGLPGTYGFGENMVGNYFESLGYKWIHHDFNVSGANRLGKYPEAEYVLRKYLGEEKFEFCRTICKNIKNIEEPDLLIYKPDYSEIRFAESKRADTNDKLRESQIRCLALYSLILGCKADVFEIVKEGKKHESKLTYWELQGGDIRE